MDCCTNITRDKLKPMGCHLCNQISDRHFNSDQRTPIIRCDSLWARTWRKWKGKTPFYRKKPSAETGSGSSDGYLITWDQKLKWLDSSFHLKRQNVKYSKEFKYYKNTFLCPAETAISEALSAFILLNVTWSFDNTNPCLALSALKTAHLLSPHSVCGSVGKLCIQELLSFFLCTSHKSSGI